MKGTALCLEVPRLSNIAHKDLKDSSCEQLTDPVGEQHGRTSGGKRGYVTTSITGFSIQLLINCAQDGVRAAQATVRKSNTVCLRWKPPKRKKAASFLSAESAKAGRVRPVVRDDHVD